MAHLSKSERRRGLEYANRLVDLARSAPTSLTKSETYRSVDAIRKAYGFSHEEKVDFVRWLLKQGCSTYADLVAESNIRRPQIVAIVQELVESNEARLTPLSAVENGRPTVHIGIINGKAGFSNPKN